MTVLLSIAVILLLQHGRQVRGNGMAAVCREFKQMKQKSPVCLTYTYVPSSGGASNDEGL